MNEEKKELAEKFQKQLDESNERYEKFVLQKNEEVSTNTSSSQGVQLRSMDLVSGFMSH